MSKDYYLYKDSNVLRLGGSFSYWHDVVDYKEFEGKTYKYTEKKESTINIDEIRNNPKGSFSIHQFEYELDGVFHFYVEYLSGLMYGCLMSDFVSASTNDYVNGFILGHEYGFMPKTIKNLAWGKRDKEGLLNTGSTFLATIHLHGYGFNNTIAAYMPMYHFLKLDTEVMNKIDFNGYIARDFKRYFDINIQKKLTNEDIIKMFNIHINNKQRYATR